MSISTGRISFFLFWRRLGIFFGANLLWILTSLPLITLPAATGALFYLVQCVIAEERDLDPKSATIADFWVGFRLHWRRSTLLGGANILALVIVIASFFFYLQNENEILSWLIGPIFLVFLVLLAMQIYLYPVLVNFPQAGTAEILRTSFFYVLAYPVDSYLMICWLFIVTIICVSLGGPIFFILFSLLAVIQSMALRVIRVTREEIPPAKVDEE